MGGPAETLTFSCNRDIQRLVLPSEGVGGTTSSTLSQGGGRGKERGGGGLNLQFSHLINGRSVNHS